MKIKNKRKAKYISALGVAIVLSFMGCKKQETNLFQQKKDINVEENEEKKVCLSSCQVLVENCSDGSIKHHFINKDYYDRSLEENENYKKYDYKYQAITDENIFFVSKIVYNTENHFVYEEIPETNGEYIYDYNVPYYMMNIRDISLPEGYSLAAFYSASDLKALEEKLNNSIYEKNHEYEDYYISDLHLVDVDGDILCFDFSDIPLEVNETTNIEDVTKLRTVYYIPCIGNDLINLKVSSGMSEVENFNTYDIRKNFVIEEITSLDPSLQDNLKDKTLITHDITDYFSGRSWGKVSNTEVKELLDKLNDPDFKQENKIKNYAKELSETASVNVSYYGESFGNALYISKKENTNEKELPNDFYEKLNILIKEGKIDSISFSNLDNTFDLSKIDYSNISKNILKFDNFTGALDCSTLTGSTSIYFTNTKASIASEILSTCNLSDINLYWKEDIDKTGDLKSFLEFLIEKNIYINFLDVNLNNKSNYNGIIKEEFELLSKVNTNNLGINAEGFKAPLNLNIELNPRIKYLSIMTYENYNAEKHDYNNVELGTIQIKSDNPEFCVSFYCTDITKNTRFSVSDSTWIRLYSLNCTDISAFKDLKKVRGLEFQEDSIGELNEGEILYSAQGLPKHPLRAIVYTDYDKVLKDLEYYFKLKKLKGKLNDLSEEYDYYNLVDIGSYVNLVNDEVPVYETIKDLRNKENAVSSYYGTSIVRCIRSVCLAKEDKEVEADNLEEYQQYVNDGYKVIGYNFINQYSNDLNDCELFCEEDDMELVLTPFK